MPWLLAAQSFHLFWYLLPLVAAISLVYGATRHELMQPILAQAARTAVWIGVFIALIFGVLLVISWTV